MLVETQLTIHNIEVFIGVFIGAITFTGSIVAFGKLSEIITGKALILPGRHALNLTMLFGCLFLGYMFLNHERFTARELKIFHVFKIFF